MTSTNLKKPASTVNYGDYLNPYDYDYSNLALTDREKKLLQRQQLLALLKRQQHQDSFLSQSVQNERISSSYGDPLYLSESRPSKCSLAGLDPFAALITLAGAAVGIFFIYTRIVQNNDGARKGNFELDSLFEYIHIGLEEFEDKIDQIAGGNDNGEEGWISSLYKKFKTSFLDTTGLEDNTIDNMDGLEPPILDETWGLSDVKKLYDSENSTDTGSQYRKKRSIPDDSSSEPEDDYVKSLTGEAKCKTKFWRCMSKVVKSGTKYVSQPGGISGAIQKTMVKMAFNGGFGNAWNALMTIPEARETKRCMNLQEQCLNYEVIRAEVKDSDNTNEKPRLIVNPDFVEGKDTSDGQKQWNNGEEEAFFNTV